MFKLPPSSCTEVQLPVEQRLEKSTQAHNLIDSQLEEPVRCGGGVQPASDRTRTWETKNWLRRSASTLGPSGTRHTSSGCATRWTVCPCACSTGAATGGPSCRELPCAALHTWCGASRAGVPRRACSACWVSATCWAVKPGGHGGAVGAHRCPSVILPCKALQL